MRETKQRTALGTGGVSERERGKGWAGLESFKLTFLKSNVAKC